MVCFACRMIGYLSLACGRNNTTKPREDLLEMDGCQGVEDQVKETENQKKTNDLFRP